MARLMTSEFITGELSSVKATVPFSTGISASYPPRRDDGLQRAAVPVGCAQFAGDLPLGRLPPAVLLLGFSIPTRWAVKSGTGGLFDAHGAANPGWICRPDRARLDLALRRTPDNRGQRLPGSSFGQTVECRLLGHGDQVGIAAPVGHLMLNGLFDVVDCSAG
jgi:hypothetical protein